MDGGTHSGMGSATLANIPSGELSIQWGEIEGYESPQPNPGIYTLEPNTTLSISGEYVESIVTADFSAFPLTGPTPLEVNFQDASNSTTKDIVEWRWYFGDGRTSSEKNPQHTYREPGTYTVTLSVVTYDQMDVISKKQYIVVTEGMPVAGTAGLIALTALLGMGSALSLARRKK
jgi:PKD repeat protein